MGAGLDARRQLLAQQRAGPQEARLDHVLADAEAERGFLHAHVLDRAQHDLAVVDEQEVTGGHVAGQAGIRRPDDAVVALDLAGRDREALAGAQRHGAGGEAPGPDLRALQVDEDADGASRGVTRGPDVPVDLLVHGVVPVGEVEPRHVHAGVDEGTQLRG